MTEKLKALSECLEREIPKPPLQRFVAYQDAEDQKFLTQLLKLLCAAKNELRDITNPPMGGGITTLRPSPAGGPSPSNVVALKPAEEPSTRSRAGSLSKADSDAESDQKEDTLDTSASSDATLVEPRAAATVEPAAKGPGWSSEQRAAFEQAKPKPRAPRAAVPATPETGPA